MEVDVGCSDMTIAEYCEAMIGQVRPRGLLFSELPIEYLEIVQSLLMAEMLATVKRQIVENKATLNLKLFEDPSARESNLTMFYIYQLARLVSVARNPQDVDQ